MLAYCNEGGSNLLAAFMFAEPVAYMNYSLHTSARMASASIHQYCICVSLLKYSPRNRGWCRYRCASARYIQRVAIRSDARSCTQVFLQLVDVIISSRCLARSTLRSRTWQTQGSPSSVALLCKVVVSRAIGWYRSVLSMAASS